MVRAQPPRSYEDQMNQDPTEIPGGWRCWLSNARYELLSLQLFKKWLYCSWAHKLVWFQLNALGNYKWKKVSGRCYPHVWHECRTWHCSECHPCGEEIDRILGNKPAQQPPVYSALLSQEFWGLR